MPCGCDDKEKETEEKETAKLRFIGGRHKRGIYRGPYLSYETNQVYEVPADYVTVPYWEAVDGDEVEVEIEVEEKEQIIPPSSGLRAFNSAVPSERDFLLAMSDKQLKEYFMSLGGKVNLDGKVDGRWGRNKLIEETMKLQ